MYRQQGVQGSGNGYIQENVSGYEAIFRLPLEGIMPTVGKSIGFDARVTDGTEVIQWNDKTGRQGITTANLGLVKLDPAALYTEARKGTPVIDGEIDSVWNDSMIQVTERYSSAATAQGAKGKFRTMWDNEYLYVLVEVDDPLLSATNPQPYLQDSVELFIDENNHKTNSFESDDAQIRFSCLNQISTVGSLLRDQLQSVTKTVYGASNEVLGCRVEAAVKWNMIAPKAGHVLGFDVQVNDDPGIGTRNSIAKWNNLTDTGWMDTSGFGMIRLMEQDVSP